MVIRQMREADIDALYLAFVSWNKTRAQYEGYFAEQVRGERLVLIAREGETVLGYGTIVWEPADDVFRAQGIPEIVDLNTLAPYQRQGVATAIIHEAERLAKYAEFPRIGISVEQSPDYANANRLYPTLGYVPDERGVTQPDNQLHLTKRLG